jgi:two-component system OmpR family response regulator
MALKPSRCAEENAVRGEKALRLLVVEDNEALAQGLTVVLKEAGYAVDLVTDGQSADAALSTTPYDLVVLDLTLPDMDGLEVLKRLRQKRNDCAVLVLTARGALDDRIRGLDLGADDYMTKPFEVAELEARIRVLLRRRAGLRSSRLDYGAVSLDLATRQVTLGGVRIELPQRELNVLQALLLRVEQVVSKPQIIESLADFDDDISENAIEQYISRLRKRLEPAGLRIRAARGLGYILEAG